MSLGPTPGSPAQDAQGPPDVCCVARYKTLPATLEPKDPLLSDHGGAVPISAMQWNHVEERCLNGDLLQECDQRLNGQQSQGRDRVSELRPALGLQSARSGATRG